MMRKTKNRKVIGFIVALFILWIGCEKLMDRVQVENVKRGSVHFDDSISLDDGTELYYISYDTCPVVYDKNRNRYFRISEKDNDTMRSMLREYGCLVNY